MAAASPLPQLTSSSSLIASLTATIRTSPPPPPLLLQVGLELTLASRALSYSSLQDALDDVAGLYNGIANLAALPAKAAEAFQSNGSGGGAAPAGAAQGRQVPAAASKTEARV